MARKNVQTVIAAFLQGKKTPEAKERTGAEAYFAGRQGYRNALWTDGEVIYSYRMVIAKRLDDGSVLISPRDAGPSRTTKAHIDGIRFALTAEPIVAVAEERIAELKREEREAEVTVGNLRLRAVG